MSSSNYQVRRATVDDLPALKAIWEAMRFPAQDLEKRLTEFQVATDSSGKVVGGVGFQIADRHGRIHSEGFSDFAAADAVRPMFWDRIQTLTLNHGIARLWTQEEAPFWKQHGLTPAGPDVIKKLPPAWANSNPAWLTLKLKDEESIVSLEKELALFMESEKQRTARAFDQARALKKVATLVAIILALFVLGILLYVAAKNPGLLSPRR